MPTLEPGDIVICNGEPRTIAEVEISISIGLHLGIPHELFILWHGETDYQHFTSNSEGTFTELIKLD